MKMTWRRYGEGNDQIKFSDIKQIPGKDCGKIVTCEEHSVIGGLGEAE